MAKDDQRDADRRDLQEHLWEHRIVIAEFICLHECQTARAFAAAVRLAGWEVDNFLVADLLNDRRIVDA